ncbi:efflux RND transporter periplasmic adaptor subunit [Psychroflexus sediminis]|uniref:Membrane fusion protein, cobalt-zinc-cadmium efflux system n=1 Tax=Psychroflexus sediminis TaxID=470826 RepID=A0A1G7VQ22_9FLAO|nr:efflux RND transporter periplasmic adaptor subunit [Psychroflexus sediminis]SDG61010.1 membrane fusion protein, cobalt-zinc-cadmium efflux system [Psychroflexus sediminis]
MKRYTYITLFIFTLTLMSCGEKQAKSEEKTTDDSIVELTQEQFQKNELTLGKPEKRTFSEEFEVTGMVDVPPKNRSSVTSYFDGYVSQTHLLVGDRVAKGDLLVKLKNPDFIKMQQNYVEALSNLEYLTSEFERKKTLFKDQIIAQKVFQATKNQYLQAKAKLASLAEQIRLMNLEPKQVAKGDFTSEIHIKAPISGKISKLNVAQGKFIGKSEMIMELLDVDHIHLELDVFEKDLMKIQKGDSLRFEVPEISEERYSAYVRLIGAEINENRKVRIHAHPLDRGNSFTVGMFVNAYFEADRKKHLALPESAFTEVDETTYILELTEQTENKYRFRKVEVKSTPPQHGFKPILNPEDINSNSKYLTNGVFDLMTTGSGGHH